MVINLRFRVVKHVYFDMCLHWYVSSFYLRRISGEYEINFQTNVANSHRFWYQSQMLNVNQLGAVFPTFCGQNNDFFWYIYLNMNSLGRSLLHKCKFF